LVVPPKEEPTSKALIPAPVEEPVSSIKPFLLPGGFLAAGLGFGAATLAIKQRATQGDQPLSLKRAGLGVSVLADVSFIASAASLGLGLKKRSASKTEIQTATKDDPQ
jgi:hypothetical protein